jgi:hypothetical protein
VKYIINPTRYEYKVTGVIADELEIPVAGQMGYVVRGTGNLVVHGDNAESLGDEAITQMRSKKSSSASYDRDSLSPQARTTITAIETKTARPFDLRVEGNVQ